jgi:hypothetical protein
VTPQRSPSSSRDCSRAHRWLSRLIHHA